MKNETDYNNLNELGRGIFKLRTNKEFTPKQMASLLNITATAYRNIETGKSDPAYTRLLHIAEILEMDVCDLIVQN